MFQIRKTVDCIIEPSIKKGGLYIGDMYSTEGDHLDKHGIKAVLSAVQIDFNDIERRKIKHLMLSIDDIPSENITQYFDIANGFIKINRQENKNVLVHCLGGISRSATLILAYLIYSKKQSLEISLNHIRNIRPAVKPNEGFIEQLKKYEQYVLYKQC